MTDSNADRVSAATAPQEVQIATRRVDGSLRSSRTIWIVRVDDKAYVRSTNGRSADWFTGAMSVRAGRLESGGRTYDVRFSEADAADLAGVDDAYRGKYGSYASIVDHLIEPGPRAATLEVHLD